MKPWAASDWRLTNFSRKACCSPESGVRWRELWKSWQMNGSMRALVQFTHVDIHHDTNSSVAVSSRLYTDFVGDWWRRNSTTGEVGRAGLSLTGDERLLAAAKPVKRGRPSTGPWRDQRRRLNTDKQLVVRRRSDAERRGFNNAFANT